MKLLKLYEYLLTNGVTAENHQLIQQELENLASAEWADGYMCAVRHQKKRRIMREKRCDHSVKRFLDYLSDLTHGK